MPHALRVRQLGSVVVLFQAGFGHQPDQVFPNIPRSLRRNAAASRLSIAPCRCRLFQVTLLQVENLQWDATGTVSGLMPSKSALSLATSSRPACGMLTIDPFP